MREKGRQTLRVSVSLSKPWLDGLTTNSPTSISCLFFIFISMTTNSPTSMPFLGFTLCLKMWVQGFSHRHVELFIGPTSRDSLAPLC